MFAMMLEAGNNQWMDDGAGYTAPGGGNLTGGFEGGGEWMGESWRELGVWQSALCPARAISTLLQVGSALETTFR